MLKPFETYTATERRIPFAALGLLAAAIALAVCDAPARPAPAPLAVVQPDPIREAAQRLAEAQREALQTGERAHHALSIN